MSADVRVVTHRAVVSEVAPADARAFRVFEFPDPPPGSEGPIEFPCEPLSLGRWVAISGAAFSTGTGYRTSLGLSLLAGLANIRLGYWWNSATDAVLRRERALKRTAIRSANGAAS
jgi:hypothetical protein